MIKQMAILTNKYICQAGIQVLLHFFDLKDLLKCFNSSFDSLSRYKR